MNDYSEKVKKGCTPKKEKKCNRKTQESTDRVQDGRRPAVKRKASPEPQKPKKRARVSEVAEPSTSFQKEPKKFQNGKRRVTEDGEGPSNPSKKRKLFDNLLHDEMSSSVDSECNKKTQESTDRVQDGRRPGIKRKGSPEPQKPTKRARVSEVAETSTSFQKEPKKVQNGKRKVTEDGEGPSNPAKKRKLFDHLLHEEMSSSVDSAAFEAKYVEESPLGEGGCGSVFAGHRKADNMPVAIKHIPKDKVYCKHKDTDGRLLSVEVAVMQKLGMTDPASVGSSAPVSLLDWYDFQQELILVLERPMPAEDLSSYIEKNGGSLEEEEAKVILKQLVDAAIHLKEKSIFHRDIKVENILIETSTDVPRVRLIDFGLSCFVKTKSRYRVFY
ncbi:unnamed protein product, partial [Menidia menidia]